MKILLLLAAIAYFSYNKDYKTYNPTFKDTPIIENFTPLIGLIDSVKVNKSDFVILYAYGYPFKYIPIDSISLNIDSTYFKRWVNRKVYDSIKVNY